MATTSPVPVSMEPEAQALLNELGLQAEFDRMLDLVRTHGEPLADDRLAASEVILPPPDTTLEEARAEFTGEGLIPG